MMQRHNWLKRLTKLVILMTVLAGMQGYSNAVVIVRLNDGRLFVVGGGRFSDDNGETWSAAVELPQYCAGSAAVAKDRIVLLGNRAFETDPGVYTHAEIWTASSTDGGKTWSEAQKLAFPYKYPSGITHKAIRLQDGTLFQGVSWDTVADREDKTTQEGSDYKVGALVSNDEGQTWTLVGEIHAQYEDSPRAIGGVDEPSYVQLPDGELYMLMRTGAGCLYEARSGDGGNTWTEATPTQMTVNDSPSAMHRLHTGEVVLIGQPAGLGRLCIWVSRDNCQTWSGPKPISGEPHGGESAADLFYGGRYCGITQAADDTIVAAWLQYVPPRGRLIQIGRFNRAWLPGAPVFEVPAIQEEPFLQVTTLS